MAETAQGVSVTGHQPTMLDPNPGADVTPTGLNPLIQTSDGVLTGSDNADRATLFDLTRDLDQVLNLHGGDDVFVFRLNADGMNSGINGIVEGGPGNNQVYLAGTPGDYVFALRGDGSIKIQYVAGSDPDGPAVTFRNFSSFTFRNIDVNGTNFQNETFTYQELKQVILANVPCFAQGTGILTTRGRVPVESLAVGDIAITAAGDQRRVVWLGRRNIDCESHPDRSAVQPIRIIANAVAPGMPSRDLRVSPDHALLFDDVLVPAGSLINGTTIFREDVAIASYWHVELESHDVLLAENMPAESYFDDGNRWEFAGQSKAAPEGSPDPATPKKPCAPIITDGPRLLGLRTWLNERSRHLGSLTSTDPGLRLLADGKEITPASAEFGVFTYLDLPTGAALRFVSRSGIPQETVIGATDTRRLGVCATALIVDGMPLSLADPRLNKGWHDPEGESIRWTSGDACLPPARTLTVSIATLPEYPVATVSPKQKRFATPAANW